MPHMLTLSHTLLIQTHECSLTDIPLHPPCVSLCFSLSPPELCSLMLISALCVYILMHVGGNMRFSVVHYI